MTLDTVSILVALGILGCSLSGAMFLIWRFLQPARAMKYWGLAMGCYGVGTLMAVPWPFVPSFVSVFSANLLFIACCMLIWRGCSVYRGTEPRHGVMAASLAAFVSIQSWYTFADPDIARRTIVMSAFIVFYLSGALVTLLRPGEGKLTIMEKVVAAALMLNVVFRVSTIGVQLHDMSYSAPLRENAIILLSALLALFGVTFWGLAVILMVLERTVSDMRLAENASSAARQLLETVIDNIPSLIYLKDRQGRLLVCNRGLAELTGNSRESLIGKNSHDLFPARIADKQQADDVTVLKTGEMLVTDEMVELGDGPHIFETTKLGVRDQQGSITAICGISTDITEHKRMEGRLREADLRLRAFIQSQIIGVVIADTAGAFIEVNDAFLHMLGYGREEFESHGLRWDAITPPEFVEQDQRIVRQLREMHASPSCEKEYFHKSGRRVPVLLGAAPFQTAGEEVQAVCFVLDLTERKTAEKALRESRQLFDTIANTSPALVWMSGLDKGCTWFNQTWLYFTGRSIAQELGDGWAEGVHPDDYDRCLAIYCDAFEARQSFAMEYRLRRHDGVYRWIHDQGHPRYDAAGVFTGYIGSCLDISQLKQAEEKVRQKNAEISDFIYAASHDLRSPLITFRSFLGFLETDMKEGDSEKIRQDLDFINSAADRMERLLAELLEMSRIDRLENPPGAVTFRELVREARAAVAGQITARRVAVQVEDADLTLTGDCPRFAQIWQNLLDNAVKYLGDQAAPLIELGVERRDDEAVFFVRDNGIGIAPEYREKVFGMFHKLDKSSTGVGLGLAMVKKIVEKYHGRIWVESGGEGGGACFRFTLPAASPSWGEPK